MTLKVLSYIIASVLSIPWVSSLAKHLWRIYVTVNLSRIKTKSTAELFSDIKHQHLDIESDTSREDCRSLELVVQKALKDGIRVVEIGSWKGMTTSVIAKTISSFNGCVFAVDTWTGCSTPHHRAQTNRTDVLSIFRSNMALLELSKYVHPLLMDSLKASTIFPDHSVDLVFIDADHRYEHVKSDIEAWLPKIRSGGIICGHDCQEYYTKLGKYKSVIDSSLSEEVIPGVCHPGVVKALYDIFSDEYSIVPGSFIWWKSV